MDHSWIWIGYIQDDGFGPFAAYEMAMGGAPEGPKVPKKDENWVFLGISHPERPKLLDQSGSLLDLHGIHPG